METTLHKQPNSLLSAKSIELIINIICYLFMLLFLYAASSKLMDYHKFEIQIGKSPLLTNFANVLVWLVPTIEIIIAVLVIIPRTIVIGLYGSLMLMSIFTAYIITILNFSESIPCSCGGILSSMNWNQHLIFNIVFVLLAVIGILLKIKTTEIRARKMP